MNPLSGKRIVITRTRAQSEPLAGPLEALGATVISVPTIEIRDPDSWATLDNALSRLSEFDYLLMTSVNGVEKLLERLTATGRTVADLEPLQVGAIGPATAAVLQAAGIRVDLLPTSYRAEGLLEALRGLDVTGKSFLIPRAKVARDVVPRVLTDRGAHVEVVEAYQTVLPSFESGVESAALRNALDPPPDLVTFTSSSTALNFARLLESGTAETLLEPGNVRAACIGPITSDTARSLGFHVALEAAEYTIPGLLAAIRDYFINDAGNDKRRRERDRR